MESQNRFDRLLYILTEIQVIEIIKKSVEQEREKAKDEL